MRTYRTHRSSDASRWRSWPCAASLPRPGELFGLLGPNGAGKTTTIKMLITLLLPTSGTARVMGHDVVTETTEVRKRIGYVFGGDRGLYDRVSALDNLRYFAGSTAWIPPSRSRGSRRCWTWWATGVRRRRSRATAAACASGCISPAACCTTRRSCSWTSRPSAWIRWARASARQTVQSLVDAGKTVLLTTLHVRGRCAVRPHRGHQRRPHRGAGHRRRPEARRRQSDHRRDRDVRGADAVASAAPTAT